MTLALQVEPSKKLIKAKKIAPLFFLLLLAGISAILASITEVRFIGSEYIFYAVSGLLTLSFTYSQFRKDQRLSEAAYYAALWVLITSVLGPLTYISATLNLPLHDEDLIAADKVLGFDWLSYYDFFAHHHIINSILGAAYHSLLPQVIFSVIFFSHIRKHDRNDELFWTTLISLLITVIVSGIIPSAGTFYHFKIELDRAVHLHDFFALRNASISKVALGELKGIVTFPSFHTAAALLLIYVYRGTKMFSFVFALNMLMLLSTPVFGGHYLADMLGGGVVMVFSIFSANRVRFYLSEDLALIEK